MSNNFVSNVAQAEERHDAARALGHIRDPIAVPIFRATLDATQFADPIILEALRKIGTPEAVRVLQDMTKSGGDNRAALARNALERSRLR